MTQFRPLIAKIAVMLVKLLQLEIFAFRQVNQDQYFLDEHLFSHVFTASNPTEFLLFSGSDTEPACGDENVGVLLTPPDFVKLWEDAEIARKVRQFLAENKGDISPNLWKSFGNIPGLITAAEGNSAGQSIVQTEKFICDDCG